MPDQAMTEVTFGSGERRLIWCDRCQSSGGGEWDLFLLQEAGITQWRTIRYCPSCDEWEDIHD